MKPTSQHPSELASSFDARLVRRASLAFDAEDSAWTGDEQLFARVSARILAAPPQLEPRFRWSKLALGGSGAAVLGLLLVLGLTTRAGAPGPSTHAVSTVSASLPLPSAMPSIDGAAQASISDHGDARPRAPEPATSSAPPPSRKLSAEELFAKASRARREGQAERAASLYRQLHTQFPSSREALAAFVPLALLELKANHFAPALTHFSAYLSRAPAGELAPEALWGEAQARLGLGQTNAARQSLKLLLMRYPNSAYAGSARAKLEALPD